MIQTTTLRYVKRSSNTHQPLFPLDHYHRGELGTSREYTVVPTGRLFRAHAYSVALSAHPSPYLHEQTGKNRIKPITTPLNHNTTSPCRTKYPKVKAIQVRSTIYCRLRVTLVQPLLLRSRSWSLVSVHPTSSSTSHDTNRLRCHRRNTSFDRTGASERPLVALARS